MLNQLQVYCSNDPCPWKGERSNLADHLLIDCGYCACPLANFGCRFKSLEKELNIHMNIDCKCFEVQCPHLCETSVQRQFMDDHFKECEVLLARQREELQRQLEEKLAKEKAESEAFY